MAHHRSGAERTAAVVADNVLGNVGLELVIPTVTELHRAAAGLPNGEGRKAGCPFRKRIGDDLVEPQTIQHLLRYQADPLGQGTIDDQETTLGIDRVKADRRILQKLHEAFLLQTQGLFHLSAQAESVNHPKHGSGLRVEGLGRDRIPFDTRPRRLRLVQTPRHQGHFDLARLAALGLGTQTG